MKTAIAILGVLYALSVLCHAQTPVLEDWADMKSVAEYKLDAVAEVAPRTGE